MRIFDAEPPLVEDLRDEGEPIAERQHPDFTVYAMRHPTLGKVIVIQGRDGSGLIVETEE